ncbi:MAG: MurR/RpiR family transcriptional regulator [Lactobacillales bacterium]|jgi:DNA-binding MurR/RpiR family transcriptional regulator|nr:MurR/RpiR family transcriptional regulator [Lactobacillales bacterium]
MFEQLSDKLFTSAEKDIFSFIMQHPERVSQMRVKDLAESVHVAPSSIIKFIHKIHFKSFYDFKSYLKQNITPTKTTNLVSGQITLDCLPENYEDLIASIAECLTKHQLVYCVGLGGSGILAEYAKHQLSIFGCITLLVKDSFAPFFTLLPLKQDCAVIFFSVSGKTKELLNIINPLLANNIDVISVTNGSANPLAEKATISFPYHVKKERIHMTAEVSTQLPVLFMIESLSRQIYRTKLIENKKQE